MDDNTLYKICLISALIGIFLILIIANKMEIKGSNIGNISEKNLNEKVKVKGYVTFFKETPGLYLMNIKDSTGNITVLAFKDDKINITKNSIIEVEGSLTKYNNELEINADIIRILE